MQETDKVKTVQELEGEVLDCMKEFGIHQSDKKVKNWYQRWWKDIAWEINWQFQNKIIDPWRSLMTGIDNLKRYRSLIWQDRWWDYTFFLHQMLFKLKEMEDHWGKDTHYVNDTDEKETLKKLIEDLEWMLNEDLDDLTKEYEAEYKKRSRSFFGRLDRHHRKLWD